MHPINHCLPWESQPWVMLCPRNKSLGLPINELFPPFCRGLSRLGKGQTFWMSSMSGAARSSSILLSFMQAW